MESAVGTHHDSSWSPTARVLFRFGFCVLALYTLDLTAAFLQRLILILHGLDTSSFPVPFTAPLWHRLVPWIGAHLLGLVRPLNYAREIGGDTPYEYILRGTELVLASVSAVVWSGLDRSHREYRTLDAWLRVFVRALLAAEMLHYGLSKVPPAQFGVLSLYRRAQPVGDLGLMAMLWAFMAASPGYALLCGLVEVAGGALLLVRRTTAAGALVCAGAMANVLVLNIFYDVNQKIRCVYYLGLSLYLASPQLPGLWRLLVCQRPAAPTPEPSVPGPRPLRVALSLVPLCFALPALVLWAPLNWHRYTTARQKDLARGPNYGVWRVERFDVADTARPLFTEKLSEAMEIAPGQDHWQRLILDAGGEVFIQLSDGRYDFVQAREDAQTGETFFADSEDAGWQCRLHLQRPTPSTLVAQGTINGNDVTASFTLENARESHLRDGPRWLSDGRRW